MKVFNYIKENKWFLLVMLIGTAIFTVQTALVVLYADDLSLGIISKGDGFLGAFSHMKYNYMEWGGGPTPMFAIMFLCANNIVWKIFSIVILTISVYCITDMITFKNKKNRWWVAIIVWACIFILDIAVSRETLYWLDGHLAYVFTTFNLLIYFYYLFKKLVEKSKLKKYDYVLLPIFAFFAGWSGPQSGSIILLMNILLFIYVRIIKKEKIKAIYYISLVVATIGFLVYYLAPGNNARFEVGFPEIAKLNMFELIEYRLDSVFSLLFNYPLNFAGLSFYINIVFGALALVTISILKEDNNIKKYLKNILYLFSFAILGYLVLSIIYKFNLIGSNYIAKILFGYKNIYNEIIAGTFKITMLVPYICMFVIILSSIIMALYVLLKEDKPILFITLFSGFLAQAIMLIAPYSPIRTVFISVVLFILAFCDVIYIMKLKGYNFDFIVFVVLSYFGIGYVIFGIIIEILIRSFISQNHKRSLTLIFIMILLSTINAAKVINGYYDNKKINDINVSRLENYDGKSKEIKLLKPIDEAYGFTKLTGIEWVEMDAKRYYNIPLDVVFVEE